MEAANDKIADDLRLIGFKMWRKKNPKPIPCVIVWHKNWDKDEVYMISPIMLPRGTRDRTEIALIRSWVWAWSDGLVGW